MSDTVAGRLGRYFGNFIGNLFAGAAWGVGFVCVLALAKHFHVL